MNLYLTAVLVRRGLAVVLATGAALVGHHVLANAQQDSVNQSIDHAQKSVQKSLAADRAATPKVDVKDLPKTSAHVKNSGDGTFEVDGGGTKVTVKGLPTSGQ